ncbi:hypothetical protein AVEN_171401-1 [Araneus ventricosus]|uniref:Uncharacterized protein n=1 Tax=Araneus ventricosus TaxID=182803 RepID=A0A4Y2LUZ9_ARAVE|nr:hypothetical protein AVEN_74279-1 [Araneus ventricosus]GBN17148.1 hypothetical protein AVEN_75110-1 [Araneus ventricosus]GBN17152.1 hypothetical protein AVEN_85380-1 [Araneus ventricosus]GBN17207.1 hypothetical protein AVEN_171401-1 [Araneus ventricosus]
MPRHFHHGISTPMLHCWHLVLGVETSGLGTTNPLYPIRTKQHVFAFVTPKDIFPLFLVPVLVCLTRLGPKPYGWAGSARVCSPCAPLPIPHTPYDSS